MSSSTSCGHHQALPSLAAWPHADPAKGADSGPETRQMLGTLPPMTSFAGSLSPPSFRGDHWGAHRQRRLPPLFPHTNRAVSPLIIQEELGTRHKTAVLLSERNRWTEGKGKRNDNNNTTTNRTQRTYPSTRQLCQIWPFGDN